MSGVVWSDAEREARMVGRFALVGQRDGRGSRHVVWVSRSSTTAAYPPADICDERTWVSFEPLFTAREVAAREAQAAAKALREAERVWQRSAWIDVLDGSAQQRIGHAQQVTEWLRQRADLLRHAALAEHDQEDTDA